MTTQTVTMYQELLDLIRNASTISEEQKQKYIDEIDKNGLSVELRKELQELFQAEANAIGREIDSKKQQMEYQKKIIEEGEAELADDYEDLVQTNAEAMDNIVANYRGEAEDLERGLDRSLESYEQKDEEEEIGDIRKNLGLN